ncbi:hypothetical protein G6F23_014910 [Rhizopus arrhizus]|nr:hypothetical protein G6F23_014910 [Rhizopus arrhizus]
MTALGAGLYAVPEGRELREVQPGQPRGGLEEADPGHPRPAGLPHSGRAGAGCVHRGTAAGHRIEVPVLPGREPLGAEAEQQHPVA